MRRARRSRRANLRFWLASLVGVAVVVGAAVSVWKYNEFALQRPLDCVLAQRVKSGRVTARAHYQQYIHPDVLVIDIRGFRGRPTRMELFSALLAYAGALQRTRYREVILAANGRDKFALDGVYFQQLGEEYDARDPLQPLYIVWEFPAHLFDMQGGRPYYAPDDPDLSRMLGRFNDFMRSWCEEDVAVREQ